MKIEVIDSNSTQLAKVKRLGKENASTLGFLPEGAFDERAKAKQILVALNDDDQCVGYLLYRVVNRQAKIAHLCIDKSARNSGAGHKLIDYLKKKSDDLLGISLKCRRDYEEATKLWERCRFIPVSESKGRGKIPSVLVHWWFDHGHPTLFDIKIEENAKERIDIVVDANVFFDFDNPLRGGYEESNALKADWLEDSLNISVVDELYQEINRNNDANIRKASREKASHYNKLPFDEKHAEIIYEEVRKFYTEDETRITRSDKSDIRQVAEAISADAQYFITRDKILLGNISEEVFKRFGLKIIRPADLIIQIDEIRREKEYQPARLSGTIIKIALVKSGQEEVLTKIFQQQESKTSFQNRLRAYLSDITNCVCQQVVDEHNESLALFVYKKYADDCFEIPLIRVKKNRLSSTLAKHLIIESVHNAIKANKTSTKISDSFVSSELKAGIIEENFIETEQGWTKFHLKIILTKNEVAECLNRIEVISDEQRSFLSNLSGILVKEYFELNAEIFADIEKSLYPIKISDSLLPCFIIPIQPQWAKELFDEELANQGLFPAKRDLALRKEQVFYRKVKNSGGLKAPARILWYVSQGNNKYIDVGAIRACSIVDEVIIEKPKIVYNLFKRLGIYEWKDVYATANRDIDSEIMAIKFSHTQLFPNPIRRAKIEKIVKDSSHGLQLFSPYKITQEVFIEIYKEGIIKNQ